MRKATITFLIISLLIFAAILVKQQFYDSNYKLESAETEVSEL